MAERLTAITSWARTRRRPTPDDPYHGFPQLGGDPHISYCGISWGGLKRGTAPPRDAAVCVKCAEHCGFRRRPRRASSQRQRGSRHLGTIADRMEEAADIVTAAATRIEAAVAALTPTGPSSPSRPTPKESA